MMPPRRRRRVVVSSEDEHDEEEQHANQSENESPEIDETQPLSRQLDEEENDSEQSNDQSNNHSYSLRQRTRGRKLPVDSVLANIRAQRLNQQPRWVPEPEDEPSLYVTVPAANGSHDDNDEEEEDQAAPSPSPPPKPSRKRARPNKPPSQRPLRTYEPKSEDEITNSEDDDWLVNEDNESVENGTGDDVLSHIALRNEQTRADEEAMSSAVIAHMDDFDAFPQWIKYLSTVLVDPDFSSWVESRPPVKAEITPVIDVLEERWNMQTNNWVKSANWEFASRQTMFKFLCTLPYCESSLITHEDQYKLSKGELIFDASTCSACSQSHQATYIVKLYGVPYIRDYLVHPFVQDDVFPDVKNYEKYEFQVGDLCHKRLRLFHAMFHFKLHVLLALRMLLDKLHSKKHDVMANTIAIRTIFQEIHNERLSLNTTASRFRSSNYDVTLTFSFLRSWFEVYNSLQSMATQYSSKDTRSARIDTQYLNSLYPFEMEATPESLFDLRPPSSDDADVAPMEIDRTSQTRSSCTPTPFAADSVDLTSDTEDHINHSSLQSPPILKPISMFESPNPVIGEPEHGSVKVGEISPMMQPVRPLHLSVTPNTQQPNQQSITPASRIKVAANLVSAMPYIELQQFAQLLGARARQDLLAVLEDAVAEP